MDDQAAHTRCNWHLYTDANLSACIGSYTRKLKAIVVVLLATVLMISCTETRSPSTAAETSNSDPEQSAIQLNEEQEYDSQNTADDLVYPANRQPPKGNLVDQQPAKKTGLVTTEVVQLDTQSLPQKTPIPETGANQTNHGPDDNSAPELVYLKTGQDTKESQSRLDSKYPPDQFSYSAEEVHGNLEIELELFGQVIPPGTSQRIEWTASQSYEGGNVATPVLVMHGPNPGKTLCLTAAVHGDELNGIEIIRRVFSKLKVNKLSGTLIGVPIVNLQAFRETSRYLPDRRDLNRFFPGNPKGSSASRIASSLFGGIIRHCDALVDLHTGSFRRTNMPQLRADLNNPQVVDLTRGFGATVILHSDGGKGTLRRAATDAGIPAVTLEAGEPMRIQEDAVAHGVKGIQSLLYTMGMYRKRNLFGPPKPTFYRAKWIRADQSGILFSQVTLGKKVKTGDMLGIVTDPINNQQSEIRSPYDGLVLGMALNQLVMPGYATYRIGIQANNSDVNETDNGPDEFEESE